MDRAHERDLQQRVDLALGQVKRVEREVRIAKQMLGRLRADLRSQEDERTNAPQQDQHRELEVA